MVETKDPPEKLELQKRDHGKVHICIDISCKVHTIFGVFSSDPVTDPELIELVEKLWELDENRLVPGDEFVLDLGGRTRFSKDGPDRADDPLFTSVKKSVFEKPTYKGMLSIFRGIFVITVSAQFFS